MSELRNGPGGLPGPVKIHHSTTRFAAMLLVGIAAGLITGMRGEWVPAVIVGWASACVTYLLWVWFTVWRMDASTTASHATREDPGRAISDLLVVIASLASLGAPVSLLIEARASERITIAMLAVMSVALSWALIHTLFTLRYASMYYRGPDGGVDFNQAQAPNYGDFAYLAFTLGMTFQVSDTTLQTHAIRMAALRHALLSYLFGTIILATLINLVAGL
ncbi:Uncharacterized membrane protein [Cryobacterium psychrotolerans]|uniref:Uncharacterized membrane protein n=1 Tax=Cryobacterium psychrotolerans TaxID=386301 RepID=A0A1G8ZKH5_9MICO|nr:MULTISPECIES: DUF1345 domain-containing protein [Cryobacterium]TFD48135.1 DUF1345 domain-containing protein [Cryobacterium sp. TMT1-2-1]TFD87516.1 DUF1345 domain-containing protein [Cryobacterium psychrotolerans]SDK15619.1 Uncharacterized membrane protein [Cryobacterium psychrotolerans]